MDWPFGRCYRTGAAIMALVWSKLDQSRSLLRRHSRMYSLAYWKKIFIDSTQFHVKYQISCATLTNHFNSLIASKWFATSIPWHVDMLQGIDILAFSIDRRLLWLWNHNNHWDYEIMAFSHAIPRHKALIWRRSLRMQTQNLERIYSMKINKYYIVNKLWKRYMLNERMQERHDKASRAFVSCFHSTWNLMS